MMNQNLANNSHLCFVDHPGHHEHNSDDDYNDDDDDDLTSKERSANRDENMNRQGVIIPTAKRQLTIATTIPSSSSLKRTTNLMIFTLLYLSQLHVEHATGDIVVLSPTNQTVDIFENAELAFGAIPLEGISGKVIVSDPEDACSELKIKPPNPSESWILLARRYPCILETKVRNAAKAGFQAIIIYSVDPPMKQQTSLATDLMTMTKKQKLVGQSVKKLQQQQAKQSQQTTNNNIASNFNDNNDHIPTVLISFIDGEDLKQSYTYEKGYTVLIIPRLPFPINAYLLPFAIVIIVCLFLMVSFLVFQIIKCIRDRRKLSRHRLTNKQLKQLLTTSYTKGSQYDTCAICLDEYIEGDRLRVLPCGHGYHFRCIDPWLTKSRRICPVCKGKVRVSGMDEISDTESESGGNTSSDQQRQRYFNNTNESTPLLRDQRQNPTRLQPQGQPQQQLIEPSAPIAALVLIPSPPPSQPLTQAPSHLSATNVRSQSLLQHHQHHQNHRQNHKITNGANNTPNCAVLTITNGSINGAYCEDSSPSVLTSSSPNSSRRLYVDAEG